MWTLQYRCWEGGDWRPVDADVLAWLVECARHDPVVRGRLPELRVV